MTHDSLKATSLLGSFAPEGVQRFHPETKEGYTELALNESRTRLTHLYPDGSCVILRSDGTNVDLDAVSAMHLVNSILAHSRTDNASPYANLAQAICEDEAHREFLDNVVDDEEYAAHLEHKTTPTAEQY